MKYKIEVTKVEKNRGDWSRKGRAEYNKPTRIIIWPQGETIWENLNNRRQRPYTIWRKEVIPTVLKELDLPLDTKVRWSQKAGCSCGCSPSFIVEDYHTFDVHVDLIEEKPNDPTVTVVDTGTHPQMENHPGTKTLQ